MFNFFKSKKRIPEESKKAPGTFSIIVVDPDATNLTDGLGISTERAIELSKLVQTAYINSKKIDEVGVKVSEHCVHANEIFYISLIIGDIHQKNSMMSDMSSIFGKMRGR